MPDSRSTIILGTLGLDIHNVGISIMAFALRQAGFEVVNLGILNEPQDFIDAAIETHAAAILLSHHCGYAEVEVRDFRGLCEEAGLKGLVVYLGGNLVLTKSDWPAVEQKFLSLGLNRVYSPWASIDSAIADLRHDLGLVAAPTA